MSIFWSRKQRERDRIRKGALDRRSTVKNLFGVGQHARNKGAIRRQINSERQASRRQIAQRNRNEEKAELRQFRVDPGRLYKQSLARYRQDKERVYGVARHEGKNPAEFKEANRRVERDMIKKKLDDERAIRTKYKSKSASEMRQDSDQFSKLYDQRVRQLDDEYKQHQGTEASRRRQQRGMEANRNRQAL